MNPKIFRAYDIRGVYRKDFTDRDAAAIGRACARLFGPIRRIRPIRPISVVVGHDARLSSPALYRAVITGMRNYELGMRGKKTVLRNAKFIIHSAGLITTPMLAFLVNALKADGGVMITASHNPKEWNGFKIVGAKGIPVSGKELRRWIT